MHFGLPLLFIAHGHAPTRPSAGLVGIDESEGRATVPPRPPALLAAVTRNRCRPAASGFRFLCRQPYGLHVRYRERHSRLSGGHIVSAGGSSAIGTLFGGVQGGYELVFPSRLMLGIEADFSFTDFMDLTPILSYRSTTSGSGNDQSRISRHAARRVGYKMGRWTPFPDRRTGAGRYAQLAGRFHERQRERLAQQCAPGLRGGRRRRLRPRPALVGADGVSLYRARSHRIFVRALAGPL